MVGLHGDASDSGFGVGGEGVSVVDSLDRSIDTESVMVSTVLLYAVAFLPEFAVLLRFGKGRARVVEVAFSLFEPSAVVAVFATAALVWALFGVHARVGALAHSLLSCSLHALLNLLLLLLWILLLWILLPHRPLSHPLYRIALHLHPTTLIRHRMIEITLPYLPKMTLRPSVTFLWGTSRPHPSTKAWRLSSTSNTPRWLTESGFGASETRVTTAPFTGLIVSEGTFVLLVLFAIRSELAGAFVHHFNY